jgi:hypothetical protein
VSNSAVQAKSFYEDVSKIGKVWTIRDENGIPAPEGHGGVRAMPFWSSLSRVEKIIESVPAYTEFEPVELELEVFKSKWLIGLKKDGLNVGINWSGVKAKGYDVKPEEALKNIEYLETKNT